MSLSPAERQKRRRQKLKREKKVSFPLYLPPKLHTKLKRGAARSEVSLLDHIIGILERTEG